MTYKGRVLSKEQDARDSIERAISELIGVLMEEKLEVRHRKDLRDIVGHLRVARELLSLYTEQEGTNEVGTILGEALENLKG